LYSCESPQFFKRILYLKHINVITRGSLGAEGPGQLPPFNPALGNSTAFRVLSAAVCKTFYAVRCWQWAEKLTATVTRCQLKCRSLSDKNEDVIYSLHNLHQWQGRPLHMRGPMQGLGAGPLWAVIYEVIVFSLLCYNRGGAQIYSTALTQELSTFANVREEIC